MPNETVQYKCPACTGPLHFVGSSGKLECDYCGSSYTLEEIEAMQRGSTKEAIEAFEKEEQNVSQEGDWNVNAAGDDWGQDAQKLKPTAAQTAARSSSAMKPLQPPPAPTAATPR